MSEIYEAIRKMAGGQAVADVGVVTSVDEAAGRCDVDIEGKAPALGAWLSCGAENGGVLVVPEVGSEAVVMWLSEMLAVVVMVEKAEKIVLRGGENGGMVNVEALKKWMGNVEQDLQTLQRSLSTAPVAGNGAPLGIVFTPKTRSVESDIEDELITH